MQGNAFLGAFFAVSTLLQEFGITQEQFRDVVHKQYVKKFGKLGEAVVQSNMEVMTAGLRAGEGDRDRRARRGRPLQPARPGAAADPRSWPPSAASGCATGGCRSTPPARRPGPRAADRHASTHSTPSSAPASATTSRPRRSPPWASLPRPPATRLRSTLPAAKPRSTFPRTARSAWSASRSARTRRCPTARRIWARCSSRPSPATSPTRPSARKMLRASCRRSRSRPAQRMLAEMKTGTPLPTILREVTESVDGFSAEAKTAVLRHHRQGADGLPEGQRHLLLAGAQDARLGRHLLHLRQRPVQGLRGLRHGLRRSPGAEDGAGDRRGERRARDRHRLPRPAARHLAEVPRPVQRAPTRPTRRPRRCATC